MFSKYLTQQGPARLGSRAPFAAWLVGVGIGAALVYWFDPNRGRRRRVLVADQLDHYRHIFPRLLGKAGRDLRHRARGLEAEARRRFVHAPADDDVLVARVRSKLGRYVSHPHALAVQAEQGRVTLAGPVLEREARRLVKAIRRIPGVAALDDQLERHRSEEHVPALQGGRWRDGERAELLQRYWTPSLRVGAAVAAFGLGALGARRPSSAALALPVASALLLRAAFDRPIAALLGSGSLDDGFALAKSIEIHAPVAHVFWLLSSFEQYPRFMAHVQAVERIDDSHYRWRVRGTAGVALTFESELLELVPEQIITLGHIGDRRGEHFARIRFEPDGGDATRLHIEVRYLPSLGAIGLGLIKLLGAHPKRLLDADLVVLKSLLERGKARIDGRRIGLGELWQLPLMHA